MDGLQVLHLKAFLNKFSTKTFFYKTAINAYPSFISVLHELK